MTLVNWLAGMIPYLLAILAAHNPSSCFGGKHTSMLPACFPVRKLHPDYLKNLPNIPHPHPTPPHPT